MRRRVWPLVLVVASCTSGEGVNRHDAGADAFVSNCTVAAPSADAVLAAGRRPDGSVILPGGRGLTPAGKVIDVGGFPLAMRVLPGDRYVVVTDGSYATEALRVVDLQAADPTQAVVWEADYPDPTATSHDPALFYGLALTADGKRLFVSDGGYDPVPDATPAAQHYNVVEVYDVMGLGGGPAPALVRNDALTIKLQFRVPSSGVGATERLPAGMVLSPDETLLYVAAQYDGSLAIVDVSTMAGRAPSATWGDEIGRAILPGIAPYDVAVDDASHTAFVSLWDGQKLGAGDYVDGVAVVDVTDPRAPVAMMSPLATGKASEAELLVGGKLYVTNADADTLSVVDAASRAVKSYPVTAAATLGASPNHLALDPASATNGNEGRVYVANAGEDSVVVLDADTFAIRGRIPTAWYPTAVAVLPDGTLLIASAKGLGAGPTSTDFSTVGYMRGVLQVVPRPSDADLDAGNETVATNLMRPRSLQAQVTCPSGAAPSFPLPVATAAGAPAAAPSPIRHVYFIVKENKTYDAILGDLETGNGDPTLVLWGETVTPNAHALARAFVTVDNFYLHAEQSLQGHIWTTSGSTNDYTEKAWLTTWGRGYRPLTAFGFSGGLYERLAHPGSGSIFNALDAAGIRYHNFGEISNLLGAKTSLDPDFPGLAFDLSIADVDKAEYVLSTILSPHFDPEPFSYIALPDDHTYGTTPGMPTPQSMVADNDEAVGRFVDGLSHSALWASSIVFVVEDDISDGGDHVEAHRSLCLVASPWIKRKARSDVIYDLSSIYRTVELILGMGPFSLYDAGAAGMYDLFTTTPDFAPYTFIPKNVQPALNPMDAPLAQESQRIDFSRPDTAPLGRILWKAVKGRDAEPPWRNPGWQPDLVDSDGD